MVRRSRARCGMGNLTSSWNSAILWGSLVALIILAIVFRTLARKHKPRLPDREPTRAWSGTSDENLDSSHIGGPILGKESGRFPPHMKRAGPADPAGAPK